MKKLDTTAVSFVVDGNWSGGGSAFLNNARDAAKHHPILNGNSNSIPIIARNSPSPTGKTNKPYILAPQNAWPWRLMGSTPKELVRMVPMRLASERTMRSRLGLLRISSAIPPRGDSESISPIIPNVLDSGFEKALEESSHKVVPQAEGAIVCIGSMHSYRNMITLLRAHSLYVRNGGSTPLLLAGTPGDKRIMDAMYREIKKQSTGLIHLQPHSLSRADCIASYRDAKLIVQPSLVEASPFTALEALSVNCRVLLSNIIGNREIIHAAEQKATHPHAGWFPPLSPSALAHAITNSSSHRKGSATEILSSRDFRESQRRKWGDSVTSWIETLLSAETSTTTDDPS